MEADLGFPFVLKVMMIPARPFCIPMERGSDRLAKSRMSQTEKIQMRENGDNFDTIYQALTMAPDVFLQRLP